MTRTRSRNAASLLACAAILLGGIAWMWIDFHYSRSQVWVIEAGPILLLLAMAAATIGIIYFGLALLWQGSRTK